MRTGIFVFAVVAFLSTGPASAADPLASLSYLVGTWKCTYNGGGQHVGYTATYDYVMGNNWLRERDVWPGGGGDVGLTTYEPKTNTWTEIVAENERTTTVFRSKGSDSAHRAYQSVLSDSPFKVTFDRVSDTQYTLHARGTYGGKEIASNDTCTKQP